MGQCLLQSILPDKGVGIAKGIEQRAYRRQTFCIFLYISTNIKSLANSQANSLTELYLLFKYLRPKELERQNIRTFDAWAAIFAKKTIDYEFSVTNEVVQKERFRYFIKVPELAMFYSEITDYRSAEDIGIARPQKNEICLLYTSRCV